MPAKRASGPATNAASTLAEYVATVDDLLSADEHPRWFRGAGRATYTLVPGLYRPPAGISTPDFVSVEKHLFQQFAIRSRPFMVNPTDKAWELLFIMQHHRMPTRLLDWTESPLVALYFALESAERTGYTEDAVVWCLDPIAWNDHTFNDANPPGGILTVNERRLDPYQSPPDVELMRDPPIAIYAPHNNARIVAQSGTFTIFGKSTLPLEELWATQGYPNNSLARITIPPSAAPMLLANLVRVGYTHSRIFPDLDGLAIELRRTVRYSV